MTKSTRDAQDTRRQQLIDSSDDIEIIEVVGLDEDSPAASAVEDDEEIVLDLADADESERDRRGDDAAPVAETPSPESAVPSNADVISSPPDLAVHERYARLQADFENFKRRMEREQDRQSAQAAAAMVRRMLPVLDNFERALALESRPDNEAALRDGVVLIFRQILDELRKEGLEALEVVGQHFDPANHHAVETDADSGFPPNMVVEELQRGYRLGSELLRPALVRVSVDAGDGQEEEQ